MAGRRFLLAIVLFGAILHGLSIARSLLPAQDGLKIIRVARQFQQEPWPDVVRNTDLHPLYPALIAAVEPVVSAFAGHGPDSWRIAAQLVSALAALAILVPLYGLTRSLFDERIASIAALIFVLLPLPAEVGHDTLSDSLGLLAMLLSLRWGAVAIRTSDWRSALAAGLAGGIGYLARPEVILAPVALCLAWAYTIARTRTLRSAITAPALPAMALSVLVLVGSYSLVKGQVSEKLALRLGAAIDSRPHLIRSVPQLLPKGLEGKGLDFSPKEESARTPVRNPLKALQVDRRGMVGRALLGLCGHVRLGPGPAAVHPRPRRSARSGQFRCHRASGTGGLRLGLPGRAGAPCLGPGIRVGTAHSGAGGDLNTLGRGRYVRLPARVASETPVDSARYQVGWNRRGWPRDRPAGGLPASSWPSHAMGPLGGRALAGPECRAVRRGARHPGLGAVRRSDTGLRLLARPPGTDRLSPFVCGRRS